MGPSRIELAPQDARGLVAHANSARHHDVVIRQRQPDPIQTEALADLPLETVSLDAIHTGLDGHTEPRSGACPGKAEKSANTEALHLAALEKLQVFGAKADPCGFGEIHP